MRKTLGETKVLLYCCSGNREWGASARLQQGPPLHSVRAVMFCRDFFASRGAFCFGPLEYRGCPLGQWCKAINKRCTALLFDCLFD